MLFTILSLRGPRFSATRPLLALLTLTCALTAHAERQVYETPFDATAETRCEFRYPARFNKWETIATKYQELFVLAGRLAPRLEGFMVADSLRNYRMDVVWRRGDFHPGVKPCFSTLSVLDFPGQTQCESPYFDQVGAYIGNRSVKNIAKQSFARTYNTTIRLFPERLVDLYRQAIQLAAERVQQAQVALAEVDALIAANDLTAIVDYMNKTGVCWPDCEVGTTTPAEIYKRITEVRAVKAKELAELRLEEPPLRASFPALKKDLSHFDHLVRDVNREAKAALLDAGLRLDYYGAQFEVE